MSQSLHHIICIDDEDDIAEVAKMCLETVGGFTVTCLPSGRKAIGQMEALKPDFILLDVMMPGFDGPSTFEELRKQPGLQNVPIAFMTARVQTNEIEHYLKIGAAGIIHKPFDPMQLATEVTKIWEKFHAK